MAQQFTSIRVNGDPIGGGPLTAGILETVIILDDDTFLEPSTTDTGAQYSIGGTNFTSTAWPGYTGSGVEIYSATVNGSTVTFGYLTSSGDAVDDAVDRLVILSGTINPGDSITGITMINGGNTNILYTDIPSIVCFTPGTIIATPTGSVAIETLTVGDLVITADNGLQAIRWIGQKRVSGARLMAHPHLRPIRIKAHAFGHNRPEQDLLVSPQHRMFLKSRQTHLMFGEHEVLVPAKGLVNDKTILVDNKATHVDYIHILFDQHQLVLANGTWSESFHPNTVGLDAIEGKSKEELLAIFPELQCDLQSYGPSARHSISVTETRHLLEASI
jgi:Hint domain-containing protein